MAVEFMFNGTWPPVISSSTSVVPHHALNHMSFLFSFLGVP